MWAHCLFFSAYFGIAESPFINDFSSVTPLQSGASMGMFMVLITMRKDLMVDEEGD